MVDADNESVAPTRGVDGAFGRAAKALTAKGWRVIPGDVKVGGGTWVHEKGSTVARVTGYNGVDLPNLDAHIEKFGEANIGIVMPPDVVAIDVDIDPETGKDGLDTYWEIISPPGMSQFLPTWSNGHGDEESAYRHYFYRVPEGVTAEEVAGLGGGRNGVDILRWMHRWSRVSPSVHSSGEVYYWLDPDGDVCKAPKPSDLPRLTTTEWEHLKSVVGWRSKARYAVGSVDVTEWLAAHDGVEKAPEVQDAIKSHWGSRDGLVGVERHGSHHDALTALLLQLAHLGEEGHAVASAIRWLEQAFYEHREDPDEFARGLDSAIAQAVAKSDVGVLRGEDGELVRFERPRLTVVPDGAAKDATEPALSSAETVRRRFPLLDLAVLVDPNRPPRRWLLDGVVPEGDHASIVAPGGTGKSLFALALAVDAVRGATEFIGRRICLPPTAKVLYVDRENSADDLAERLRDLGVTAENVGTLRRLHLLHLPPMRGLDTASGATELMSILDTYGIGRGDLLILDSTQRVTEGPENDADTFRAFYAHSAEELKRRGITVIRTDNTGKDTTKGARGTSAKVDDIGYGWQMDRASRPGEFWLTETKHRAAGTAGKIGFTRTTVDGALRFLPLDSSATDREVEFKTTVSGVLRDFHEANAKQNTSGAMSQAAVLKAVREHGLKFRDRTAYGWLGDMVKSRCLGVTETSGRGVTTKSYRWCSDYIAPDALTGVVEGVTDGGEEAY